MSENMAILNISQTDSEQYFRSFIQSCVTVFDKHAPMKTKRVKKKISRNGITRKSELIVNNVICIARPETGPSTNIGETKQQI